MTTTEKENSTTMTSTSTSRAEHLLEERRKAAVPMVLTLATSMVSGTSPNLDAVDLARASRHNPPPPDLLAAGLEAVAGLALELADALTVEAQR